MYPLYQELDITDYFPLWGFYTLDYVRRHRPDVELIPLRFPSFTTPMVSHEQVCYDWLVPRIESLLRQGRIVALLPEDEHVCFNRNQQLIDIVNHYSSDPVYWVTQFDTRAQQAIYQQIHDMKVRMIELPWCLLNDCLTYYRVRTKVTTRIPNHHNFLCMVNNQDTHKMQMLKAIHRAGLSGHGLLTLRNRPKGYDFCEINPYLPYSNVPHYGSVIGAYTRCNGVWISANVENYLHIEHCYNHIPLIINAETVTSQFMNTEKSIWPVLLGHLFLVWGRPGTMAWIQKFYDIDIQAFANTEFDQVIKAPGGDTHWTGSLLRLDKLLTENRELIVNCVGVYQELAPALQSARWSFGKNLYEFFVQQLQKIG